MRYLIELKSFFERDKYRTGLFVLLVFLIIFSIYALHPHIAGDSFLYVDSIKVLETGTQPVGFIPMMIVSTYLGLKLIMFLNFFTGHIEISWLLLDSVLYFAMGMFFYSLLKRILKDARVAFLGTLFLVTNYAAVSFGLGFLMDMGGWVFYVASLYFSYLYLNSEGGKEDKWLYISSALVGIGGLYKEYAFVAYVVVFGLIIFKNWRNWPKIFKKVFITLGLALGPFLLLNVYGFISFHYTYLNWLLYNHKAYAYQNKIVEFIKSFGSIYNFGWFLFVGGFVILLQRTKKIFQTKDIDKNILFIWLTVLSCLSVLLWPVVTRVLFITMPATVLISCLFIKRINKYLVLSIFVAYVISSYLMDAYILNFVNLPF
jgi:hypothetical protein